MGSSSEMKYILGATVTESDLLEIAKMVGKMKKFSVALKAWFGDIGL